jgi:hypothetical protein
MPVALNYVPGDLVDVRSAAPTWYPGVVSLVDNSRIIVDLDLPHPTGDEWSGTTLRYGGNEPVEKVTIWKASEALQDPAAAHIRIRP